MGHEDVGGVAYAAGLVVIVELGIWHGDSGDLMYFVSSKILTMGLGLAKADIVLALFVGPSHRLNKSKQKTGEGEKRDVGAYRSSEDELLVSNKEVVSFVGPRKRILCLS